MKRIVVITAAAIASGSVFASCPVADALIEECGISFSGFERPVPKAGSEPKRDARTEELMYVALPNPKGHVFDGFTHTALVDKVRRQAWIHRTGGFVGVNEWYGPVELKKELPLQCNFDQAALTRSSTPTPDGVGQQGR